MNSNDGNADHGEMKQERDRGKPPFVQRNQIFVEHMPSAVRIPSARQALLNGDGSEHLCPEQTSSPAMHRRRSTRFRDANAPGEVRHIVGLAGLHPVAPMEVVCGWRPT
jgi:hypothetical protein